MDNLLLYAAYILGFFVVFYFAFRNFNQPAYKLVGEEADIDRNLTDQLAPALPVYMTDGSRYKFYRFIFVAITEVIFILLTRILSSMAPSSLVDNGALHPIQGAEAVIPIIAALAIAGVIKLNEIDRLNRLKWVKPFIDIFKENLHFTAKIPKKGQQIYSALLTKDLDPDTQKVKELIQQTLNNPKRLITDEQGNTYRPDLQESDFTHSRLSIPSKWARLSYLINCIEQWETDEKYGNSLLQKKTLKWRSIHLQYEETISKVIDFKNGDYGEQQENDLNEVIELLLLNTYRLISCLLLITCKNQEQPCDILQEIGFTVFRDKDVNIPLNAVTKVGGYILAAIIVGSLVAGSLSLLFGTKPWLPNPSDIKATTIATWVAYGVPMHLVPVIIILLAKKFLSEMDYWPITRTINDKGENEEIPWGIYFVVTSVAYFAATLMVILFIVVLESKIPLTNQLAVPDGDIPLSKSLINSIAIYSLGSIVTGFFMCYRIDTPYREIKENKARKFGGALLQGGLTALVLMFSFAYVENDGSFLFHLLPNEDKVRLVSYTIVSFFVGASIFLSARTNLETKAIRKHQRIPTTQQITTSFNGSNEKTHAVDISPGGIALQKLSVDKKPGDIMIIHLPNDQIIEGSVVDVDENNIIHIQFKNEIPIETINNSIN